MTAATAGRALPNVRAGLSALAPANITLLRLGNGHFLLATVSGLLEANFHVVAEVVAALRLARILPGAAKKIVENAPAAEHFTENLERIMKASAAKSAGAAVKCGMAILVISRALLWIIEHLVGLAQFFKAFFRGLITGVFVRMEFDG